MGATVLHVIPTFGTGGLGACCLNMVRGWPDKSVTHQVLSPLFFGSTDEMLAEFVRVVGRKNVARVPRHVAHQPPVWAADVAKVLEGWWRESGRPTHVIQYNSLDTVFTLHALRRAGYTGRVLVHVGTTLTPTKQVRGVFNTPLHDDVRYIPVHSGVGQRTLTFLDEPNRAKLLPPVWNATDLNRFTSPPRTRARVFGFAARMANPPDKDWETLFDAWAEAAPNIPGGVLHIAGDGPHRAHVETLARGPVEFLGNLPPDRMPDFYRDVDVFVMASLPIEGFPNVLSEAYAARCLVLGTDVPGVRESLEFGGGAEFLAPDPSALAGLMVGLQNEQVRQRNAAVVERVCPRLACSEMAHAYWNAGRES